MPWHFTILKMCVHEEYHLVSILQDYLVSIWYVILMRNSNSISPLIISSWIYLPLVENKWFIILWGSNILCAYYKPRKCEHLRYCHLELILEIILFLCGMVAQTISICLIGYLLDLVCERFS
jgi:hypothetical protein